MSLTLAGLCTSPPSINRSFLLARPFLTSKKLVGACKCFKCVGEYVGPSKRKWDSREIQMDVYKWMQGKYRWFRCRQIHHDILCFEVFVNTTTCMPNAWNASIKSTIQAHDLASVQHFSFPRDACNHTFYTMIHFFLPTRSQTRDPPTLQMSYVNALRW